MKEDTFEERLRNLRKYRIQRAIARRFKCLMAFDTKPKTFNIEHKCDCLMLQWGSLTEIAIHFSLNEFMERITDYNNLDNKYVQRYLVALPKCCFRDALPIIEDRFALLSGMLLFDENYNLELTYDYPFSGRRVKKEVYLLTPQETQKFLILCACQYKRLLIPLIEASERSLTGFN